MATKDKTTKRAASDDETEEKPSKGAPVKKRVINDSEAYHKTVPGKLKLKGVEITTK